MKRSFLITALIIAYCFILGLPFIFRPKQIEDNPDRKLVILSPHQETFKYEYAQGFKEWMLKKFNQKVGIEWFDIGGTAAQVKYMRSSFAKTPSGIGIDLFFGGGTEPYLLLAKEGFIERYVPPAEILNKIPESYAGMRLYDKIEGWYGASISSFGIIYNNVVSEEMGLPIPLTWADLGDPKLYGWVGSGDPAASGTVHMMFEIMTQSRPWNEAWKLVTQIGGNTRAFLEQSSNVSNEVAVGEVSVGISVDFYANAQVAEAGKEKVGFVLPKGMTIMNPDGIAILKGAPNADLAKLFVQYILSEEGQRILMLPVGDPDGPKKFNLTKVPMLPELFKKYASRTTLTYNPYVQKQWLKYDFDLSSKRWGVMNDLWRSMIMDNHDLLVEAWGLIIKLNYPKSLADKLFEPLVTEEEVRSLANDWSDGSIKRTKLKNKWSTTLKERYGSIIAEALKR